MKRIKIGKTYAPIKDFQAWLVALRSGKYSQTKETLQDNEGFCCLGVACDLFIPDKNKKVDDDGDYLFGEYPKNQPDAPNWLKAINDDLGERLKVLDPNANGPSIPESHEIDGSKFFADSLKAENLNDDLEMTFNEIADILEAVYLLEVV